MQSPFIATPLLQECPPHTHSLLTTPFLVYAMCIWEGACTGAVLPSSCRAAYGGLRQLAAADLLLECAGPVVAPGMPGFTATGCTGRGVVRAMGSEEPSKANSATPYVLRVSWWRVGPWRESNPRKQHANILLC